MHFVHSWYGVWHQAGKACVAKHMVHDTGLIGTTFLLQNHKIWDTCFHEKDVVVYS